MPRASRVRLVAVNSKDTLGEIRGCFLLDWFFYSIAGWGFVSPEAVERFLVIINWFRASSDSFHEDSRKVGCYGA
jgi:hypothetical protein